MKYFPNESERTYSSWKIAAVMSRHNYPMSINEIKQHLGKWGFDIDNKAIQSWLWRIEKKEPEIFKRSVKRCGITGRKVTGYHMEYPADGTD